MNLCVGSAFRNFVAGVSLVVNCYSWCLLHKDTPVACNGDLKDACSAIKTRGLRDETSKEIVEEVLEVDYNKGCTTLYKMIEEQDWESIAKFMDTGYWIGSLWADKVPPAEQAKTWVSQSRRVLFCRLSSKGSSSAPYVTTGHAL
jgi:hypothetical protein